MLAAKPPREGGQPAASRRAFLRFLAGSPLLATAGRAWPALDDAVIRSPEQALSVLDFEAAARQALPPAHFGYLATGVDDDGTLEANRAAIARLKIRMRRLVDVRKVDTSCELFGRRWPTPIVLAPAASQRAYHPEGELAAARAAKARDKLQILSTVATASYEDVSAARGEPVWFQLYPSSDWAITERLLGRVEAAGCPVVVLTVDLLAGSNRETQERFARRDTRACAGCHGITPSEYVRRKPMYDGIDVSHLDDVVGAPGLTWEFVQRLRDRTRAKLVLKGIVAAEDAELCLKHGIDGVVVSNHGGRAEASGRGAIECLPEVVSAVGGRIPVLVDSGFRRGTDVFKALALGARAVGIGRPYLWGLGSFGQPGVERVLELLRAELELVMRQAGVVSLARLDRSCVVL
jgi:isopentenyl diphosphate isomerase/L-lactate dehydrogenase-like FMN-dependent dehydrogenase